MKKFYALALAAAVTLSASAERLPLKQTSLRTPVAISEAKAPVKEMKNINTTKAVKKGTVNTLATAQDYEGEYDWYFDDLMQGASGAGSAYILVDDPATGSVTITLSGTFSLTGTLDAAAGTLSIPNGQYLFDDEDGPIYFYVKDVNELTGTINPGMANIDATVGYINDGYIEFDPYDVWCTGDYNNESLGWYFVTAYNEFDVAIAWVPCGTGTFTENIVYGLFMEGENLPASVSVYEHPDYPGVYKVADAFQATYAALEIPSVSPDMEIDARDASNVQIALQSTGIIAGSGGASLGTLYYFNTGWYNDYFGIAGTEEELDPVNCTLTKDAEGNVTITIPVRSCYIMASATGGLYYGSEAVSTLTFNDPAGVSNVQIDNSNAPVEYFNLQGVRVNEPAAGNIYIRRQGTEAQKFIAK